MLFGEVFVLKTHEVRGMLRQEEAGIPGTYHRISKMTPFRLLSGSPLLQRRVNKAQNLDLKDVPWHMKFGTLSTGQDDRNVSMHCEGTHTLEDRSASASMGKAVLRDE